MNRFLFWGLSFSSLCILSFFLLVFYGWITTTPIFAIRSIDVTGNIMLSRQWLLDKAGIKLEDNLFSINVNAVAEKLKRSSVWIKDISLSRILPDGLRLKVDERIPFFWVKVGDKLYYADKRGEPIAPVKGDKFAVFPYLEIAKGYVMPEEIQLLTDMLRESEIPFPFLSIGYIRINFDLVEIYLPFNSLIIRLDRKDLAFSLAMLKRIWQDLQRRGEIDKVAKILVYNRCAWVKMERLQ